MNSISSSKITDTTYRVESLGVQYRSDEYAIAIDWTAMRSWKVPFHKAVSVDVDSVTASASLYRPKARRKQRTAR